MTQPTGSRINAGQTVSIRASENISPVQRATSSSPSTITSARLSNSKPSLWKQFTKGFGEWIKFLISCCGAYKATSPAPINSQTQRTAVARGSHPSAVVPTPVQATPASSQPRTPLRIFGEIRARVQSIEQEVGSLRASGAHTEASETRARQLAVEINGLLQNLSGQDSEEAAVRSSLERLRSILFEYCSAASPVQSATPSPEPRDGDPQVERIVQILQGRVTPEDQERSRQELRARYAALVERARNVQRESDEILQGATSPERQARAGQLAQQIVEIRTAYFDAMRDPIGPADFQDTRAISSMQQRHSRLIDFSNGDPMEAPLPSQGEEVAPTVRTPAIEPAAQTAAAPTLRPTATAYHYDLAHIRVCIREGDLFAQNVDAIVNAANERCLGGGGLDAQFVRRGGARLAEARQRIPEVRPGVRCPTGEARLTTSGDIARDGNCSYAIHAVGPVYRENDPSVRPLLKSAFKDSIRLGHEQRIGKIAFPALSAGIFGYPLEEVVVVFMEAVAEFDRVYGQRTTLHEIRLILRQEDDGFFATAYNVARQRVELQETLTPLGVSI